MRKTVFLTILNTSYEEIDSLSIFYELEERLQQNVCQILERGGIKL